MQTHPMKCFQACLASILDTNPDAVPHFFEGARIGDTWTQAQWEALTQWATSRGHQACWLDPDDVREAHLVNMLMDTGLHYVAFVDGPMGPHCVVHRRGKLVHDPAGRPGSDYSPPFLLVVIEPPRA